MIFRPHTLDEERQIRFYQTPKVLFESDIYKDLGMAEKLFYSILRDRQELSRKNKWVDDKGNIFLIFTVEHLSELCKISTRTVVRYKKELIKFSLLQEVKLGQGKPNRIYIGQPDYSGECQEYNSRSDKSTILEVTKVQRNDTKLNETEFKEDIYSSAKAKQEIPYKEIIDYLNKRTGKKYKHTSSGNKIKIKARWNEGYTLEDFKKVIDVKVNQWSKDKKMQQYLRPNTLFSNKFDNYLNEEIKENGNKQGNAESSHWEVL